MTSGLTAVAHLADLLRLPRAQRDAVFALGERELANGQTEQAIETLQIAAQLDTLNPTRFRRLGDALRAGGRVAEADLYTQFAQELAR